MKSTSYIVTKYSELHLKKGNKKEFINVLIKNINNKFVDNLIDAKALTDRDRIIIHSNNDLKKVPTVLKYVVGISSFAFYYDVETSKENIKNLIKSKVGKRKNFKFRISAKLIDNNIFESKEKLITWLAWFVTNELEMKIDLSNFDVDINIRIEGNVTTLFFEKEKGIIGLPAGANGKAITLLSGGIDSPVAAYKTISRGVNTSFLTFLTPKTANSDVIHKIKNLALKVNQYNGIDGKLFLVNFEKIQEQIMLLNNTSYRIILLRRYFMRFTEIVSNKFGYKFIITGDALGQVASQTAESMTLIDISTEQLVVRPLISMAKNEIINIAEEIGTYKISIMPGDDMCSIFAPSDPIIFPKKKMLLSLEKQLCNMDEILLEIFKNDTRIIELKELKNV